MGAWCFYPFDKLNKYAITLAHHAKGEMMQHDEMSIVKGDLVDDAREDLKPERLSEQKEV